MLDVVAHSISVMVVQAECAKRLMARDPSRAKGIHLSFTCGIVTFGPGKRKVIACVLRIKNSCLP